MRIRHYGFLANRCRGRKLVRIRAALALPAAQDDAPQSADAGYPCRECRRARLRILVTILPLRCAVVVPFANATRAQRLAVRQIFAIRPPAGWARARPCAWI